MTNRRNFLRNASLLAAGGIFAGKSSSVSAAMPGMSQSAAPTCGAPKVIGLQIYSLGRELHQDVPGGLKKIKAMGYTTLELAGYNDGKIGATPMAEFKKMCDDAGLLITSTHVNPPEREYSSKNKGKIMDFWKKAADDHAQIGVKYLIQPGQPASTRSTQEVEYVGEIFNGAGEIAKAAGLQFGYHNHAGEFAWVQPGGKEAKPNSRSFGKDAKGLEVIYDGMLKHTDPSLVFFELDVYWAVMGQADPVEYMRKYNDRIRVLHIKDRAVLGQSGMMNFEMIFNTAYYAIGKFDYFVELEGVRNMTQFEGVKGCAEYLMKAPFVK
ncbi:sugar phosphate isomerase/epimerase [Parabacteroides sp. PF5-6]|uniref:sugar phosphate isomerase/epimerase family protein n=1 Tax=Parabacteroides sp. PF5-6 TaxID=1742403 RepID=UPI002407083A|nr:sugar phosphate isomerase/epimerase [Parabacteroides sp. PF5-6]MDF9830982.1 sugar phosphate isomerase/epimerase [Parabacteroides sp. PF5-6]